MKLLPGEQPLLGYYREGSWKWKENAGIGYGTSNMFGSSSQYYDYAYMTTSGGYDDSAGSTTRGAVRLRFNVHLPEIRARCR